MSHPTAKQTGLGVFCLLVVVSATACTKGGEIGPSAVTPTGKDAGGAAPDLSSSIADAVVLTLSSDAIVAPTCSPKITSCTPPEGGQYCGDIGDGCGSSIACADCPAGMTCGGGGVPGLCGGGAGCPKYTCTPPGGQYCDSISDGCGGSIACPACGAGFTCQSRMCIGDSTCVRKTCDAGGGYKYCGSIGSGCGEAIDCGTCAAGATCGEGTIKNLCIAQAPACVPKTCTSGSAQYCGNIGDGCGRSLTCGTCPAGDQCKNNLCVPSPCTPIRCAIAGGGQYCGDIGDGCGGALACGNCPNNIQCGTSVPGVCGIPGCAGLCAQVADCGGDKTKTSISGTVYDPAGALPLYNVVVYVPNAALDPIPAGPSCNSCDAIASGSPLTTAITDAKGQFKLTGVPSGTNIPLVVQVGKWRRKIVIPSVTQCVDNPAVDKTLRLPSTQSEGDMPKIAMVVGYSDGLDCLLRRVGIADAEFTAPGGTGKVSMYTTPKAAANFDTTLNGGAAYGDSAVLWASVAEMKKFDMLVMSCEGTSNKDLKTAAMHQAMKNYADAGGKIFGSHWQDVWVWQGPAPWPTAVIDFPMNGTSLTNLSGIPDGFVANIDTTFVKGAALADWLVAIAATTTRGQLPINGGEHTMNKVLGASTRWIYGKDTTNTSYPDWLIYTSFGTPVEQPATGAPQYCGKVVMTDLHVFTGSGKKAFPSGCDLTKTASAQEKALEFMLFDLSACVQIDTVPPAAPPPTAVPPAASAPAPPPPAPPPPSAPPPPPPAPPPVSF